MQILNIITLSFFLSLFVITIHPMDTSTNDDNIIDLTADEEINTLTGMLEQLNLSANTTIMALPIEIFDKIIKHLFSLDELDGDLQNLHYAFMPSWIQEANADLRCYQGDEYLSAARNLTHIEVEVKSNKSNALTTAAQSLNKLIKKLCRLGLVNKEFNNLFQENVYFFVRKYLKDANLLQTDLPRTALRHARHKELARIITYSILGNKKSEEDIFQFITAIDPQTGPHIPCNLLFLLVRDEENADIITFFIEAVGKKSYELVSAKERAGTHSTLLHQAARYAGPRTITALLSACNNEERQAYIFTLDCNQCSPLHEIVFYTTIEKRENFNIILAAADNMACDLINIQAVVYGTVRDKAFEKGYWGIVLDIAASDAKHYARMHEIKVDTMLVAACAAEIYRQMKQKE